MHHHSWIERASSFFLGLSFLFLIVAVIERVFNFFNYTIIAERYTPGRLMEFAAIFLLFVIALILRSIREEMRKT
jgi:hypothetical protein